MGSIVKLPKGLAEIIEVLEYKNNGVYLAKVVYENDPTKTAVECEFNIEECPTVATRYKGKVYNAEEN